MFCDVKRAFVRHWSKEEVKLVDVEAHRLEIQAFDEELSVLLRILAHRQITPAPRTFRGNECWRITCTLLPEEIEDVVSALQHVGCTINVPTSR